MPESTTTSVQHTPAPWMRTTGDRFRHDHSAGIKGPDGTYVAAALDFNRTDRDEEVEANACLIAAAPELLASVKELLNWLVVTSAIEHPEWINTAMARKATAAILKGEGRTP